MQCSSEQYRPDIDGLRAVAVLLVVAYHAFPEAIRGGFIGVDIFFVISGFLITGIIARDLERARFSLATFYARRIRRIFPALIVVLCVVMILGWLWMLPLAYAQLSSDVFFSAAFSANIALMLQSGYFDVESAKRPLLHLWSLGIEEQFYLAWPLILMLAARLRLSLLWVASAIGFASFALNVALIAPPRLRPSTCRSPAPGNCWLAARSPAPLTTSAMTSARAIGASVWVPR